MTWAKYFEDDTLANEWFDRVMNRLAWKMFERQEDWVYMVGELGPGRNPMIKSSDKFDEAFGYAWRDTMSWLAEFAANELLRIYAEDDIDFPHDLADDYNDCMGFEPDDDGYVEGKDI